MCGSAGFLRTADDIDERPEPPAAPLGLQVSPAASATACFGHIQLLIRPGAYSATANHPKCAFHSVPAKTSLNRRSKVSMLEKGDRSCDILHRAALPCNEHVLPCATGRYAVSFKFQYKFSHGLYIPITAVHRNPPLRSEHMRVLHSAWLLW